MSWSVNIDGTPDEISDALDRHSETISDQSLIEFNAAKPHLQALVRQNFDKRTGAPKHRFKLKAWGSGWCDEGVQVCRSLGMELIQIACILFTCLMGAPASAQSRPVVLERSSFQTTTVMASPRQVRVMERSSQGCQCGCGRKRCRCGEQSSSQAPTVSPPILGRGESIQGAVGATSPLSTLKMVPVSPSVVAITGTEKELRGLYEIYQTELWPDWKDNLHRPELKKDYEAAQSGARTGQILFYVGDRKNREAVNRAMGAMSPYQGD